MPQHFTNATNKCPNCGYELDFASPIEVQDTEPPKVGDYTFCVKCATLLQFGLSLSVYIPDRKTVPKDLKRQAARMKRRIK